MSGRSAEVHAVDKGRARGGPHVLITEVGHVPHQLVHELRKLDGVAGWAGAAASGTRALAVGDVGLVVGGVKVLAVPAVGEDDGLADHLAARLLRDADGIRASAGSTADEVALVGRCPAAMADVGLGNLAVLGVGRVTGKHAEALDASLVSDTNPWAHEHRTYRSEGGGLAAGNVVDVETTLVDELTLGTAVADLGNAVIRSVLVLEKHDGRPVVGQILGERAGCAGRSLDQVILDWLHSQVEGVTTNDLVKMGSVADAGVDERIDTVDNELGAGEPQHVLSGNSIGQQRKGRGEGRPRMHIVPLLIL